MFLNIQHVISMSVDEKEGANKIFHTINFLVGQDTKIIYFDDKDDRNNYFEKIKSRKSEDRRI